MANRERAKRRLRLQQDRVRYETANLSRQRQLKGQIAHLLHTDPPSKKELEEIVDHHSFKVLVDLLAENRLIDRVEYNVRRYQLIVDALQPETSTEEGEVVSE